MERTPAELTLEDLLPGLEKEYAAEENDDVREAVWTLINAVEEYILIRQEARRQRADAHPS